MKKILVSLGLFVLLFAPASAFAVSDSETEHRPGGLGARIKEAKENARERSTKAKEEAKQRKLEVSEKKCESMKGRIAEVVPKMQKGVTQVKSNLDKKYDRIKAIHDKGTLQTAEYDTLAAKVEEAKAQAETAISLIDPSTVTVDCAVKGLGTQLDSYRATVKEARTSLKVYRTALVNLVSAMHASADKQEAAKPEETNNATN